MDTIEKQQIVLPAIGGALLGGFFAGQFRIGNDVYANIIAPKAEGEFEATPWNSKVKRVEDALSFCDSLANTDAMVAAGSKIAKKVRALKIGGFDDWTIPALDVLELGYRHLKPTAEENYLYARAGINVSAAPSTYPYTADAPGQTAIEAFKQSGAEAFEAEWYWTSTQYAANYGSAWLQGFGNGLQGSTRKVRYYRVRAVRRVLISHSSI